MAAPMDFLDKKKRMSGKGLIIKEWKLLPYLLATLSTITMATAAYLLLFDRTAKLATPTPTPITSTTTTTLTHPHASSRINELSISHTQYVQNSSKCHGKYIYVYPLPPEFNEGVIARCHFGPNNNNNPTPSSYIWHDMCGNLENLGLGLPIPSNSSSNLTPLPSPMEKGSGATAIPAATELVFEPKGSWYRTEQFTLEVFFHHRIKTYECLTLDPSLADAFYIPYYAGLDVALNLFTSHAHLKDRLAQRLMGWLGGNDVWQSYSSHKTQFIALGRIAWDQSRSDSADNGWGSSFLSQPEMANVTKLIIERKPGTNKEIGIPYPTPFHPTSYQQIQAWQEVVQRSKRKWLVTFVGSPQRSRTLRGALMKQCKEHPRGKCRMVECRTSWTKNAPNSLACVENPEKVLRVFAESVFCLQPGGDSPTRKSMFDSLLTGCIPVLFSNYSAYKQYSWHLPVNDPTSWSAFYPEEKVLGGNNNSDTNANANDNDNGDDVVSFLERIDSKDIKRMQETIIGLIPHIIYTKKPWSDNNYSGDVRDAFDIAIENVLQNTPIYSA